MMDRLMLDEGARSGHGDGLRTVAEQDDPVGRGDLTEWDMPSGLNISSVSARLWA